jgi:hypothetical protein
VKTFTLTPFISQPSVCLFWCWSCSKPRNEEKAQYSAQVWPRTGPDISFGSSSRRPSCEKHKEVYPRPQPLKPSRYYYLGFEKTRVQAYVSELIFTILKEFQVRKNF